MDSGYLCGGIDRRRYGSFEQRSRRGGTDTNINAGDMVWVLREAAALYRSNKPAWRSLQKAGMTADFSWGPSAKQYLEVYQKAMG